jgi:hypothetical protein
MKKILVLIALLLVAFTTKATEPGDDKGVNITHIVHPKYDNVLNINVLTKDPIIYVVLKDSYGEVLYTEKVNNTKFNKKISFDMNSDDLKKVFTFEVITEEHTIKYKYIPYDILVK